MMFMASGCCPSAKSVCDDFMPKVALCKGGEDMTPGATVVFDPKEPPNKCSDIAMALPQQMAFITNAPAEDFVANATSCFLPWKDMPQGRRLESHGGSGPV